MEINQSTHKALAEYAKRRSMALSVFRPQPQQEPFFRHYAREWLVRGGTRSGKSTIASIAFGAIATDTPVTMEDGTKIDMRQPWQKGKCLTMWVIGYDSKHIGQTVHRLLFRKGLFRTIVDKKTNMLRSFRLWEPEDAARENEAKDSNPVIPAAFIDPTSWDWENKKGKEFKSVTIWNPQTKEPIANIFAFSSKAEPKQGDPVDVIWIDEAIQDPKHYDEWQSRIVDRRGRIFWSSWPKIDNNALMLLTERAESESDKPEPLVREIVIATSDNKALHEKNKAEFLAGLSDEARRARDRGEYITDQQRAYPLYDRETHCVKISDIDLIDKEDGISRELSKTDGIPPREWTRELILDPGTQHPAVLFCAIPPITYGEYRIIYQELYPGRADAFELAELIKKLGAGQRFYRFIIDARAGRQQQMGYDARVADNYIRAFKKERIKSISLGYRFVEGCGDVGGRMGCLREWLHYQDGQDYPTLRIVNHRCPNLCKQMKNYKLSRVNNDVREDRPAPGQAIDLAVAAEYWAASKPRYVPYSLTPEDGGAAYVQWIKRFGRKKSQQSGYHLGPNYVAG